jgi:hypothetical protein
MAAAGGSLLALDFAGFAGTGNVEQSFGEFGAIYKFARSEGGWETEAIEPPAAQYPRSEFVFGSADLSKSLWQLQSPPASGQEVEAEGGVGFANDTALAIREESGGGQARFTPIGPITGPEHVPTSGKLRAGLVGASADLAHVLLSVEAVDEQLWPGDTTVEGESSLYEYHGTDSSEPRLVGVSNTGVLAGSPHVNEGAELVSRCGTLFGAEFNGSVDNAVSASGATVFFTALACTEPPEVPVNELYARVEASHTVAVSEPVMTSSREAVCSGVCRERELGEGGKKRSAATFWGASESGTKVFFTTAQPLLNVDEDEGSDLYEAELGGPEDSEVTRVAMVSEGDAEHGDTTPGEGADVETVAAIAGDGARVYFTSSKVLTDVANGNGESAGEGLVNLYVYEGASGRTAFVAREPDGEYDATRDGRFLVFESASDLIGTNDRSSVPEMFEYDAETGAVARVSAGQLSPGGSWCAESGHVEAGYNCDGNTLNSADAPIMLPTTARNECCTERPTDSTSFLSVAANGTVAFVSRDALAPEAASGGENVYEYREGDVYLVSPGDEAVPIEQLAGESRLLGIDESGQDVFFSSTDRLVPQALDSQASWYDAREGGGFPAPSGETSCNPATCQGPLTNPPPISMSGGTATAAPGQNLAPPAESKPSVKPVAKPKAKTCKKGFVKRKSRCVKAPKSKKAKKADTKRGTGR